MKRRYILVGLALLLMLVLLVALTGPTSAQAERWKAFTATFAMQEYAAGTVWFPGGTEFEPKKVMQNRNEYYGGLYTALDVDLNPIDELSGYLVVCSDWRARLDKEGNFVVSYVNKSTLYVGATSAADVGNGIWQMSAVGETVYLPVEPWVTDFIKGEAHGVAGDVKGWVMKFTGAFADAAGCYLEK